MGLESVLLIYGVLTVLPYTIYHQFLSSWPISVPTLSLWLVLLLSALINLTLAVTTDPGKIYEEIPSLPRSESHYCRQCELYTKPPRAHHCRKCKICVKRMDHHCYWIDNCVGFYNQGHFVRFIFSATAVCHLSTILLTLFAFDTLSDPSTSGMFNSVTEILVFSLSSVSLVPTTTILSFLSYNQLVMLLKNQTTIESLESQEDKEMGLQPQLNRYDKGAISNVSKVLGSRILCWMLPQPMIGDGQSFLDSEDYDSL